MAKKIGSEVVDFNKIPTVREKIFVVESVSSIDFPTSIKIFDSKRITIKKVEDTSRENFVRINGDFEVRIEGKLTHEIGDPIRSEEDAKELLINSLKKEREKAELVVKSAKSAVESLTMAINKIEDDGLQYNEEGTGVNVNIMVIQ